MFATLATLVSVDELAGLPPALALVPLALLDSLSFGTLLIPVWLLLTPGRVRVGRMLVYLGTIAACYLVVGVAIMLGASAAVAALGGLLDSRAAYGVQLVLGAGLFALSWVLDSRRAKASGGGRITRWRARAMGAQADAGERLGRGAASENAKTSADGSASARDRGARSATTRARPFGSRPGVVAPAGSERTPAPRPSGAGSGTGSVAALMGLAFAAALLEVATMLPYLAGIGIITTSEPAWGARITLLAGYCVVMVLPALVLLGVRLVAAGRIAGPLERLEAWLSRSAASTTAWIVGIVGVLLALDALRSLGALA